MERHLRALLTFVIMSYHEDREGSLGGGKGIYWPRSTVYISAKMPALICNRGDLRICRSMLPTF